MRTFQFFEILGAGREILGVQGLNLGAGREILGVQGLNLGLEGEIWGLLDKLFFEKLFFFCILNQSKKFLSAGTPLEFEIMRFAIE